MRYECVRSPQRLGIAFHLEVSVSASLTAQILDGRPERGAKGGNVMTLRPRDRSQISEADGCGIAYLSRGWISAVPRDNLSQMARMRAYIKLFRH